MAEILSWPSEDEPTVRGCVLHFPFNGGRTVGSSCCPENHTLIRVRFVALCTPLVVPHHALFFSSCSAKRPARPCCCAVLCLWLSRRCRSHTSASACACTRWTARSCRRRRHMRLRQLRAGLPMRLPGWCRGRRRCVCGRWQRRGHADADAGRSLQQPFPVREPRSVRVLLAPPVRSKHGVGAESRPAADAGCSNHPTAADADADADAVRRRQCHVRTAGAASAAAAAAVLFVRRVTDDRGRSRSRWRRHGQRAALPSQCHQRDAGWKRRRRTCVSRREQQP